MTSARALRARFGVDLVTSYLAGGLSLVSGLILLPVAAGTVGLPVYGTWLALSAIQQLIFAIDLGAGTTLVRFSAAARPGGSLPLPAVWALGRRVVGTLGAVQLLIYLLAALAARAAGDFDVDYVTLVGLGVGIFLVGVPLRLALHVLQGTGHYSIASVYLIVGTLLGQSLKVVAMVAGTPNVLLWLAVGDVVTVAVPGLLAWIRLRGLVAFPLLGRIDAGRSDALRSRDVLSFAGNNAALVASGAVLLHGSTLVVGLSLSPSAVAIYDAATKIFQGGRRLLDMVMGPLLPWATVRLTEGEVPPDVAAALFRRLWRFAVLPLSIALVALCVAAPWLVDQWLGARFADAVLPLQILVGVLVLQTFLVPGVVLRQATNRFGTFSRMHVAWMLASLVLAVPLVQAVGLSGAPLAVLLPLVVLFVPMLLADGPLFLGDRRVIRRECASTGAILAAGVGAASLVGSGRSVAVAVGVLVVAACLGACAVLVRNGRRARDNADLTLVS